ncbi:MAG: NACHT domain-containing protein, partial [Nostoc sp.]
MKALSSEQIQQYLELVGHSQLWQSIEDDPSLRELAKSPLLLRMMTLASQEILSWELQGFNSAEEPHWYLFDGFIRSMLRRNRNHRQICYASGKEPTPQQT